MAGSTNFLQFNPTAANQEDDSAYAADSQRSGGAINGQDFNDVLANKAFYQWSTFIAALAQSLANKGYVISDSDIGALESALANIVTFADLKANLTSVAFSTTPVFNAAGTNGFDFVLAGNVSSSTLTGTQVGQTLTFVIVQGSTPYTFTPPTNINGWIAVPMVANTIWIQTFIVRQDGTIWPTSTEVGVLAAAVASLQTSVIRGPVVTNSNGSYYVWSDGTIEAWGTVSAAAAAGQNDHTINVTFPVNFTVGVQSIQTTLGGLSVTGGKNKSVGVVSNTLSGFSAGMAAMVYVGGSGGNFSGSETINWRAIGK